MQCIWSRATKTSPWGDMRCRASVYGLVRKALRPLARAGYAQLATTSRASIKHTANDHVMEPPLAALWLGSNPRSYTAAQLSRAAAQAVRLSPPREALYVVNSLHFSTFPVNLRLKHQARYPERPYTALASIKSAEDTIPHKTIDFGQPVSPRLAAHSFLHLLLRRGQSREAAQYAELMMQQGIRLRMKTMQAILESLCSPASPLYSLKTRLHPRGSIQQLPSSLHDPNTGPAYKILQLAREFGQHRSDKMYETLITALLIQGEIIIGSLLFVLLIRDWEAHRSCPDTLRLRNTDMEPNTTNTSLGNAQPPATFDLAQVKVPRKHRPILDTAVPAQTQLSAPPPFPSIRILKALADHINYAFLQDPPEPGDDSYLQEPLQALANLISREGSHNIYQGYPSTLIRTLYNCPKTNEHVWISQGGKPVRVQAYAYFHDCLLRLITSLRLPDASPHRLDLHSCNTLLRYALLHRQSPALASDVLKHICTRFKPDIVTINILLRCGTLMRRMDITDAALEVLRQSSDMRNMLEAHPDRKTELAATTPVPLAGTKRKDGARQFCKGEFRVPVEMQSQLDDLLEADLHTIVAYIQYLTSTGRPHVVAQMVFTIVPELSIVDHPSWGNVSREEREQLYLQSEEKCLRRAAQWGPHFFAALINALVKAGRTGLAERVWMLAQRAERASWQVGFADDVRPWCLSIHSYTAMIQCYAAQMTRKNQDIDPSSKDPSIWRPGTVGPWVRGWARYIYTKQEAKSGQITRNKAGEEMTVLLFRTMLYGVRQVIDSLLDVQDNPELAELRTRLPVPDARFFNAMLVLFRFGRARIGRTQSVHRRFLEWSLRKFAQDGKVHRHWTPLLQELGEAMVAAGYPIPAGYRHLFVGRWPEGTRNFEHQTTSDRRPLAFPRSTRTTLQPNSLPVFKSRGLPVRRVSQRHRRADAR